MISVFLMFLTVVLDSIVPLVPGEAALLASVSAAAGLGWPAIVAVALLGATAAFVGDNIMYELGRRLGIDRFAWMRKPEVAEVLRGTGDRLARNGLSVISTARLVPGWRVAVTFMAGATRMPRSTYRVASAVGALLWSAYLLTIGSAIGALTGGNVLVTVIASIMVMALLSQAGQMLKKRFARSRAITGGTSPREFAATGHALRTTQGASRLRARAPELGHAAVGRFAAIPAPSAV